MDQRPEHTRAIGQLLLAALLIFGCAPRLLTDRIQPAVAECVAPKREKPVGLNTVGGAAVPHLVVQSGIAATPEAR